MLEEHRDTRADRFTRRLAALDIRLERIPADLRERLIEQARVVA
jgi:hypothetical protein